MGERGALAVLIQRISLLSGVLKIATLIREGKVQVQLACQQGGVGMYFGRLAQVKVYSSRRQESHLQKRWATGAVAGARGYCLHH